MNILIAGTCGPNGKGTAQLLSSKHGPVNDGHPGDYFTVDLDVLI